MTSDRPNPRIRPLPTAVAVMAGCVLTLSILLVVPRLSGGERPEVDASVVALVDGREIRLDELEASAAAELQSVDLQRLQCETGADKQRHQVLEAAMERVVRGRLLEIEANERQVAHDVVTAELRASAGDVAREEVETWYEANKSRIRQPLAEVEDQIREILLQERVKQVETRFYDGLKERYDVDYLLEPFRLQIEDAGFPSVGPENAAVTIVEFSDFECPFCQRVLPTLQQVKKKFGSDVRLVFRQFPLNIHANAMKAAEASLCARDQGKFWEMHDLMFEDQSKLTVPDLKQKASDLALDMEAFVGCLDSGDYADEVQADLQAGSVAGVNGTPAMFVNGRPVEGAVPFAQIAAVIEDEIARLR